VSFVDISTIRNGEIRPGELNLVSPSATSLLIISALCVVQVKMNSSIMINLLLFYRHVSDNISEQVPEHLR